MALGGTRNEVVEGHSCWVVEANEEAGMAPGLEQGVVPATLIQIDGDWRGGVGVLTREHEAVGHISLAGILGRRVMMPFGSSGNRPNIAPM